MWFTRLVLRSTYATLIAAATLGTGNAQSGPAGISPLPGLDSAGFVRLQGRVHREQLVRVSARGAVLMLSAPRLGYRDLTGDSAVAGPRRIVALSSISTIEVPVPRTVEFAIGGSLLAATAGFLISAAQGGGRNVCVPIPDSGPFLDEACARLPDWSRVGRTTLASAVAGAVLGVALGALAKDWKSVYVAR